MIDDSEFPNERLRFARKYLKFLGDGSGKDRRASSPLEHNQPYSQPNEFLKGPFLSRIAENHALFARIHFCTVKLLMSVKHPEPGPFVRGALLPALSAGRCGARAYLHSRVPRCSDRSRQTGHPSSTLLPLRASATANAAAGGPAPAGRPAASLRSPRRAAPAGGALASPRDLQGQDRTGTLAWEYSLLGKCLQEKSHWRYKLTLKQLVKGHATCSKMGTFDMAECEMIYKIGLFFFRGKRNTNLGAELK
ncbi:uncharacterized protein WM277_009316 [Molossus nigricans]